MKDVFGKIQYKDKEYRLVFNLNVMEVIQEEYGTIEHWGEITDASEGEEPNMKAVIFGFKEMLNEAIDMENDENGTQIPMLTHKQVGRMITEIGLDEVAEQLNSTVVESVKSDEKNA